MLFSRFPTAVMLILLIASSDLCFGAERPDPVDLLLDALRMQGRNANHIQSGKVTAKVTIVSTPPTEDEIRVEIESHVKLMESLRSTAPDERRKTSYTEQIENAESIVRKHLAKNHNKSFTVNAIFRGSDQFTIARQETISQSEGDKDPKRTVILGGLQGGVPSGRPKWTYVGYTPHALQAHVESKPFGFYHFAEFGYARGRRVQFLTAHMLATGDPATFQFDEKHIAQLRMIVDATKGIAGSFSDIETKKFEGSEVFIIKTTDVRLKDYPKLSPWIGRVVLWIDPSRGFICPRIIEMEEDHVLAEFESAKYVRDERSGRWVPQLHIEREYDSKTGKLKKTTTFEIEWGNSQLNIEIPDSDFAIRIPERMLIQDRRQKPYVNYRVQEEVPITLDNGFLRLTEYPQLYDEGGFDLNPVQATRSSGSSYMLIIIAVNGVVICGVLWAWLRRRKERSASR